MAGVFVAFATLSALVPVAAAGQDVTFTRDVAPILHRQCASCHRPGGAAPFSLLSFEDVRSRAQLIVHVTTKRLMPPWKPVGGGPFIGERSLAVHEMVSLPRRTTIHTEFVYDNSARNPRNPDSPPRRVLFGQNSSDEIGDMWFQTFKRPCRRNGSAARLGKSRRSRCSVNRTRTCCCSSRRA